MNKSTITNGTITVTTEINSKHEIELTITDAQNGKLIQRRALGPDVAYDD